jgi:hypothetical protein
MRDFLDRLHWPQVFLLMFFLGCCCITPIAFFHYVDEHTQQRIFSLPWSHLVAVGLPALGIGISGFLSPFIRPVLAKTEPDSKSPNVVNVPVVVSPDPDAARWPAQSSNREGGFANVYMLAEIVVAAALLGGALLLHGCGAAPLQVASVGVTVGYAALGAADEAYEAPLHAGIAACPAATTASAPDVIAAHDSCVAVVDATRDRDLESVLDALDVVIDGIARGIAVAIDIDAGQSLPDTIIAAFRQALGLFDRIEAALLRHGIATPPELQLVVHAIASLVGGAAVDPVALRSVSRLLVAWRADVAAL